MLSAVLASAQQRKPAFVQFPQNCADAKSMDLIRGDTLLVNCEGGARAYNVQALRALLGMNIKNDTIRLLLAERAALTDSVRVLKDSVIARYAAMNELQNRFYADMRRSYDSAYTLALRSTQNTDAALALVKKSQAASYITSGLVGGVAGGFIGGVIATGGQQVQFNLPGALLGLAVGVALNYVLLLIP
jgi:hypothetical protein